MNSELVWQSIEYWLDLYNNPWKALAKHKLEMPLCKKFLRANGCDGCPIKLETSYDYSEETPYHDVYDYMDNFITEKNANRFQRLIEDEYKFLITLIKDLDILIWYPTIFDLDQVKPPVRGTLIARLENNTIVIAGARCSKKDQFIKSVGRYLAISRSHYGSTVRSTELFPNYIITRMKIAARKRFGEDKSFHLM
jgi:hypothetical protein